MRGFAAILMVVALAACEGAVDSKGEPSAAAEGYTLEIRASELEQTFLVTAPDGRVVGARAAEGASALMDADRARAMFADPPPAQDAAPEVMSLRVPGFEMSVGANEEGAEGDHGQVRIAFGDGAQRIEVNANDGGPGENDDRAFVRITGADAEAVREFIAEADQLSPEVQAQMLTELGL